MTNSYQINAFYAISKAKDAVKSWEEGVANAKAMGATPEEMAFCERSLQSCVEKLAWVRRDVKENWTAYL